MELLKHKNKQKLGTSDAANHFLELILSTL